MSLSTQYWSIFVLCCVICTAVQYYVVQNRNSSKNTKAGPDVSNSQISSLQNSYLLIILLVSFADWMQGPYLYQLLIWYGFSQTQIAFLFVMGIVSSLVVGLFIGSISDRLGRRFMCVMCCLCYTIATLTNFWPYYHVLIVGRCLTGAASGMLFNLFESWIASEFSRKGLDNASLGDLFVNASFVSGIAGVLAGLAANSGAANFGFAAPFGLAMFPLLLAAILIRATWDENYGSAPLSGYSVVSSSSSSTSAAAVFSSLSQALPLLRTDASLLALAGAQSLFEGGLYLFLFLWTPALYTRVEMRAEQQSNTLPESSAHHLGLIFSTMMVCVLLGSGVSRVLQSTQRKAVGRLPLYIHLIACLSMTSAASVSENKTSLFGAFLLFLMSVGLFYPTYGVIKSEKIPEESRSGVINAVRVPVLLVLCALMLHSEQFSTPFLFVICAISHALGFLCYFYHYTSSSSVGNLAGVAAVSATSASADASQLCEERMSLIPKLDSRSLIGVSSDRWASTAV